MKDKVACWKILYDFWMELHHNFTNLEEFSEDTNFMDFTHSLHTIADIIILYDSYEEN